MASDSEPTISAKRTGGSVRALPFIRTHDRSRLQALESAGRLDRIRRIRNLPNPNELYLRVVEEMYEPQEVEKRVGPGEEAEEGGDA